MMFKSIRLKLTVWYAVVLLMALGVFGITAYLYTSENLNGNLDVSLRSEAEWLKEILESQRGKTRDLRHEFLSSQATEDTTTQAEEQGESAEDYEIWDKIYEHSLLNAKKQFIYVFDRQGRTFYKSYNLGRENLPSPVKLALNSVTISESSLGDKAIRLASLDTRLYRIRVAYPEDEITDLLQNLFSIFLLLIPIVLLISVLGGYFLAKKSLRPVDEITQTARKITATNLQERIHVANSRDEIGRLTETLNEMIERLEASFEKVTQFSMDASHELRTPLTIMRGEIELALRETQATDFYRETLASLLEEVVRMARIIDGLILLAKADGNDVKLEKKPIRLDVLANEIKEDAEVLAERKQISISILKLDEATVMGDEIRLRQLMLNLVDNAVKYTSGGGKVTLSLEMSDGNARFMVEDTGIGIPPKHLEKIFDRFYRIDKSRSRLPDGLGLGLSISKWVAEAHGGRLLVESKVGKGSKFTVILPAIASHEKNAETGDS
jgi:heavy metal sensor kinase